MIDQAEKEKPTPDGETLVELIAGPLCGSRVKWPAGEMTAGYSYYGGLATYEYEGEGKAKHKRG